MQPNTSVAPSFCVYSCVHLKTDYFCRLEINHIMAVNVSAFITEVCGIGGDTNIPLNFYQRHVVC
jgi:hypothetical protein